MSTQTRTFKTYLRATFPSGQWDSDKMLSEDEVIDLEPLLHLAVANGDTVVEHRGATLTWTPYAAVEEVDEFDAAEDHLFVAHQAADDIGWEDVARADHTHPTPTWVYALLFTNALLILVGLALVLWR